MTEGAHFLAVKPLSVKTTRASCADAVILNVMRHNARELQAEIGVGADSGIDASRIHLNVTLHGPATADGVASAARDAMREHGIVAPRKNATLGIEIVASLPAGLLIDHLAYFRDTAAWAQQHYRVPLLSAIVHNDESSPHLHLVLLPVRDGKLVGSELLGNRATMKAMQKDFHEQVAKQYGLRMPAAKKRHSAAQRAAGIALLRDTLQENSGLTERAIDALLVPHAKNPEPLLVVLGLAMPAPVVKGSFVATMTRKVRPESPGRICKKSPIGHLRAQTADGFLAENEMSYALLGLPISAPNFPSPANPSSASNSVPGQQASSSPAAKQSTTDQQRERSITSIEQYGTDTGNPASPALATRARGNQAATLPHDATEPGKAGMALSTVGSTVEAIAVERTATKRQAKTVITAQAGTTPKVASTTSTTSTPATAHHQAASIEQSAYSPAGQVATAKTRKRTSRVAASTSPSPRTSAAGIAPAADQADPHTAKPELQQAGHQQDLRQCAHAIEEQAAPAGRPQTGDAGIEVTVDIPATRTSTTGIVPANDTRAGQPAVSVAAPACQHLASNDDVTPRNAKASHAATAKRTKASTVTPASVPAAPRAGKRSSTASRPAATPSTPSTSARSTSSTASPSTSTPKPKRTATLQQASGTPAQDTLPAKAAPAPATPTRRTAPSRKASSTPALGKGQYDAGADQPDEIRTLGLAACSSMSNASTAPTTRDALKLEPISPAPGSTSYSAEISAQCSWPKFSGQQHSPEYSGQLQVDQQVSQRAGEDDPHGAPALDWLPMPAPRINDSATARQPATAHEDESGRHDVDSYQRLRDDENAAELWDSDLGEFVTAQARPARRTSTVHTFDAQCADDQGAVWFDARPAVIEAALDSIRAVHGQH